MECLKCGAVVADEGAVYCCECGARLDGKKACPECGQFIDEKYTFCVFCGTRVDGKTKCPTCGVYHAGAFCPDCGESLTAVKPVHKKASAQASAGSQENGKVWNTVFAWIRAGLGLALTTFALVFVFLIGFRLEVTGSSGIVSSLGFSVGETTKLYYYFGDVYKIIAEAKKAVAYQSELPILSSYIHAITGTCISVATIGCVVGFAIPAIVGFVKFATTRVENNGVKWGIKAVIAYLAGTMALYVMNAVVDKETSGVANGSAVFKTVVDKATLAGIILCIIFLALFAVTSFVAMGKAWKRKETILNCAFGTAATIFAIVICLIGQRYFVGLKITQGSDVAKLTMSQNYFARILVSYAEVVAGATYYNSHLAEINISFVFAVLQEIATIGVAVCALCAVAHGIFEIGGKGKGSSLFIILTVVFAVLQLVFGIVANVILQDIMMETVFNGEENVKLALMLGGAIVTVVFAGLLLATTIVHNKTAKKFE